VRKSTFSIIVTITGIALAGIIIIQFYWIQDALQLKHDQFDSKVQLALKGTVNQMYECKSDTCSDGLFCSYNCLHKQKILNTGINVDVLKSLIHSEFKEVGLNGPYIYGIYSQEAKQPEYISDKRYSKQIIESEHAVSLSCIYRNNALMLSIWFPDEKNRALSGIFWWLLVCLVLLILLVFGFIFNIYSFLRQKKIAEVKSDFVNNITHEFKTPIATISLASEMLLNPAVLKCENKALKYARIIYDENTRLKKQVEHVLQLAVLDRGDYTLSCESLDVHDLIHKLEGSFQLIVKERNGSLKLHLDAINHQVYADRMHLSNIITNLLDNANKYSPDIPDITIDTFNRNDFIVIAIEDRGIGINIENQKHIFRKMYRVHTGNLHDVKGFGLGLYYVKKLVDAHNGEVDLHSEPGKGSRFEISLPLDFLSNVSQKKYIYENQNFIS
jgi:two-component system, OmpR family, phosphate regulon sensor histidine kinase PhoR